VTADVSINSLHLTDVDIGYFNADMRLTPPLRQGADRDALRAALADGTIDALVSDHNPVAEDMKNLPFGEAEPGATGLELLLSLALRWGRQRAGPAADAGARDQRPGAGAGRRAGLAGHQRRPPGEGGVADVCLFDPGQWAVTPRRWSARASTRRSASRHRHGLPGRVRATLVAGTVAYEAGRRRARPEPSLRACWRLLRPCCTALHGLAGAAALPVAGPPAQRQPRIGWWSAKLLRVLGMRCRCRAVQARRQAGGGQPRVVAGHHGRARGVPQARFVSKADVQALAAAQPAGGGGRHAVHRARKASATRCAWCTRWPRRCRRRHGGGVPRRHHGRRPGLLPFHANLLQAAIATATPVQPVALRYADAQPRREPGGAVGGRHHAGAKPVALATARAWWCPCCTCCRRRARPTPTGARWPSTCASDRPGPACRVRAHDAPAPAASPGKSS
jgi:hypothetical protein